MVDPFALSGHRGPAVSGRAERPEFGVASVGLPSSADRRPNLRLVSGTLAFPDLARNCRAHGAGRAKRVDTRAARTGRFTLAESVVTGIAHGHLPKVRICSW